MRQATFALLLSLAAAGAARAAPPPPPQGYVYDAAGALSGADGAASASRLDQLIGPEARIYENGELVADGGVASLAWLRAHVLDVRRRVIGHAQSSGGFRRGAGEALVLDEFDSVDRSRIPPDVVADPWWATRAILCQFGPDHRITTIRVSTVGGFWEGAQPAR